MSLQFRNPDTPVGYNEVKAEARHAVGDIIDGVHCLFLGTIIDSGIFDSDNDDETLSILVLSDWEEEEGEIISHDEKASEKETKNETVSNRKKECTESYQKRKETDVKKKSCKRIKKEYDNVDDNSSESSSSKKTKFKTVSRSPSPEYEEKKIKQESKEPPSHLFGSYTCEVCHITMNSLSTYNTHVIGKRHLKNLKAKNVKHTVAKTIPSMPVEETSKYPRVASGTYRMKMPVNAQIQELIETKVTTPLPGLDLVTEIQGISEVIYYCSICDSVCAPNSIIPHLTGFKHQLNSLKHFKRPAYEKYRYEPKKVVEKKVCSILREIELKTGREKMAVEQEIYTHDPKDVGWKESRASTSRGTSSTSYHQSGMPFADYYHMTVVPDTSSSDFYCKICQSHMNSEAMWESHIRGKRHLTNIKKMPGALPSKAKTVAIPHAEAFLLERLRRVSKPIVGLDHIQETQIPEANSESYQCFLCGGSLTSIDIIDHLFTLKHRTKYLEHIEYPGLEVLVGIHELTSYSLVEDMCAEVEQIRGRGFPKVHVTKNSVVI